MWGQPGPDNLATLSGNNDDQNLTNEPIKTTQTQDKETVLYVSTCISLAAGTDDRGGFTFSSSIKTSERATISSCNSSSGLANAGFFRNILRPYAVVIGLSKGISNAAQ